MDENRRKEPGFFEALFGIEIFRSFFAKLCVFLAFGFGMNLVENEAICYMVLVVVLLVFCIKIALEDQHK